MPIIFYTLLIDTININASAQSRVTQICLPKYDSRTDSLPDQVNLNNLTFR